MAEFYWIMTTVGLEKRADAEEGGALVQPAQLAVGDGNGAYHDPDQEQTALVNERWRGALNRIYVHPTDATLVVCEALIPLDVGGWTIREAGIIDAAGDLIAVGKYPLTEKPDPSSGAARAEYVRGGFRISNGGSTVLMIDTSLVMATQEYVDAHALLTDPHQSTSAATADRLVLRDANGRAKIAAPVATDDIARKDTVDNHAAATAPHSATHLIANERLVLRDSYGRSKVAIPAEGDDIARKDTVDSSIAAHAAVPAPHSGHMVYADIVIQDHELEVFTVPKPDNYHNNTWYTWDVSASGKVPAGYRYAYILVSISSNAASTQVWMRPQGSSASGILASHERGSGGPNNGVGSSAAIVPVGADRQIQYSFQNVPDGNTPDFIIFRLQGYIK